MGLTIGNISYAIDGAGILRGVSAQIGEGDSASIVGPNGSGKTTLANIICGVCKPTSGTVRLGDQELVGMPPHGIARAGVSRMLQTSHLAWNSTVLDNVCGALDHERLGGGTLRRVVGRNRERYVQSGAREWLERIGLQEEAYALARELSLGQQRLLALIRALAFPGRLIVLDEPFSGIKGSLIDSVLVLLQEERSKGRMILLIDHTLSAVERFGAQVWFLANQRLSVHKSFASLRDSDEFAAVYLGDPTVRPTHEPKRASVSHCCPSDEEVCLALRDVWGGYTDYTSIVNGASIECHTGEVVCILGRNGSGKSTLLRLIAGFLIPSNGHIALQRHDITRLSPDSRTERGLWMYPQNHRIFRSLSIRDNVTVSSLPLDKRPLASLGLAYRASRQGKYFAHRALEDVANGMKASQSRRAGTLSGGEQARLALAILDSRPKSALLMDEPTAGVDGVAKQHLRRRINDWTRDGTCIVIVEHDYDFVRSVADRVVLLSEGRIVELANWRSMSPKDMLNVVLSHGATPAS